MLICPPWVFISISGLPPVYLISYVREGNVVFSVPIVLSGLSAWRYCSFLLLNLCMSGVFHVICYVFFLLIVWSPLRSNIYDKEILLVWFFLSHILAQLELPDDMDIFTHSMIMFGLDVYLSVSLSSYLYNFWRC